MSRRNEINIGDGIFTLIGIIIVMVSWSAAIVGTAAMWVALVWAWGQLW